MCVCVLGRWGVGVWGPQNVTKNPTGERVSGRSSLGHHNASLSDAPCCSPNTMTASITASPQGQSTPHQRDRAPPAGRKTARTRKKSSVLIVSMPAVVDHRGSAVCSSSGPTLLPLTSWIQIFCCVVVPLLSTWVMGNVHLP